MVGPLLFLHGPALPSEPAQYGNLTNSRLLLAVSNSEGVGRPKIKEAEEERETENQDGEKST